jgi:6,7-dimethyl-8-ribityllumazine synthase
MANATDSAQLQPFDASNYRVGIAVGLFNSHITTPMKDLAIKTLNEDYQIPLEQIVVIEVAGAADMPVALEALARRDDIDCLMTIAAIIRGDTAHFDFVAKIVTEAVKDIQIKHCKPVAFGVLTTDTQDQATSRINHASGYAAATVHAKKSLDLLNR